MPDHDFEHAQAVERELGWVWVACHCDWSGFALFDTEIEALRYAVDHSMAVHRVPTHADVRRYIEEQHSAPYGMPAHAD